MSESRPVSPEQISVLKSELKKIIIGRISVIWKMLTHHMAHFKINIVTFIIKYSLISN